MMLSMIIGFLALTIDLGRLILVKGELQNAADAAAMAGASYLLQSGQATPNWTLAEQNASAAIALNHADGATLSNSTVTSGYWNVVSRSPSSGTGVFQKTQPVPMTSNDLPAVAVTVGKQGGENGGEVRIFFAGLFGQSSKPLVVSAAAAISHPSYEGPGALFPVAIATCLYDHYWDASANPPKPKNDSTTNLPYVFKVTNGYTDPACAAITQNAQWTSFAVDKNDVTSIRDLITNGNPTTMSIGDNTWIEPGTKNTLYTQVSNCSAAGNRSCEYVTLPVVNVVNTHAQNPIVAFACVHILSADKGSNPYIEVEMSSSSRCPLVNSGGVGPNFGINTPPRLVL